MKLRFLFIGLFLGMLSATVLPAQTAQPAVTVPSVPVKPQQAAQSAKTAPAASTAPAVKSAQSSKNAASGAAVPPASATPASATDSPAAGAASLSGTYRDVSLGMDIEAVKAQLLTDPLFGYRGERDVSLLPTRNRSLIESVGGSFIRRSWFQFHDDKLYIMTFTLDDALVDYYSLYSAFVSKYGEPVSLDPRKAVWDDGHVALSLERPLTVKYVDVEVFKKLLEESGTQKAASDISREKFINDF